MSAAELSILAVDDERPQLEDLARLLRHLPEVGEVQCASGGREALQRVTSQAYDAIFLDVRMPDLDGLELARVLRQFARPPQIVLVSAYDASAMETFELHALDYLRKPVARRRLQEAVDRVRTALEVAGHADGAPGADPSSGAAPADGAGEMVAVANLHGGTTRLLRRGSIQYVQSYGDFVRVVTPDGRYLLRATLTEIEHRWGAHGFVRVHRQYVANLRHAVELRPMSGGTAVLAFRDEQTIPVARRHAAELARRLRV